MPLGNFLSSLDLAPETQEKLMSQYGPSDPDGAPSAEELTRYGAKPNEVAVAQAANSAPPTASMANPSVQPGWTPAADEKRTASAAEAASAEPPTQVPEEPSAAGTAATPGHYVAPHWQPGTRSEAVRYGMDPEKLAGAQSSRDAATGHQIEAGRLREDAANQQAQADFSYAQEHARLAAEAAAQDKAIQDQKRQYVAAEQEKLAHLSQAATQKVDADAAQGSAGAQLAAAIGVALGQFGASINGGPNTAMQIVQNNIDRQIKAQEANIANAGKAHDRESSLYRQNLEAFGDRERAVLATKMQLLDQAKAMADQTYAKSKGSLNEADKHAWDAEAMAKQGAWQQEFAQLTDDKHEATSNEHFVPGQTVGGAPAGKPLSNIVTLSDGTSVQMPNEKQQDKAIEKIQIIDKLQRYNNEALQVRKQIEKLDPILDRTDYKTAHKRLEDLEESKASMMSTDAGQGVLRDSEYARSVARQGFYTEGVGFFKGNPFSASDRRAADENIQRQIKRGDEDQRAFVKAAGGHIVKQGYTHDASGQLAPSAKYTGQDIRPTEQLAPAGSVPMKKSDSIPTADAPLGDTTPKAEDFGYVPTQSGGIRKAGKGEKGLKIGRKH